MSNIFPGHVKNLKTKHVEEYTDRERRIIFFGDSFVEPKEYYNWTRSLSDKLERQHINYGRGGSSLHFSINCFFKYIETDYREDDYIVFVSTSYTRFPKVHPHTDPGIAAAMLNYLQDQQTFFKLSEASEAKKYYDQHKETVKYMSTIFCNQEDFRHQLMLITSYLNNMKNTTVYIPGFHVAYFVSEEEFNLVNVAEKNGWKGLINHLTEKQNETLAKQVVKYIETNDKNAFDLEAYND